MSARDPGYERSFLLRARASVDLAVRIGARLDAQEARHGDRFIALGVARYAREIAADAVDLAAWATLLAEAHIRTEPSTRRQEAALRALTRVVGHAAGALAAAHELAALYGQQQATNHPAAAPTEHAA